MMQNELPPQPRDWRLATQLWMLTSAINYVEGMQPPMHFGREMLDHWLTSKRDVLAEMRRELDAWTSEHGARPRRPA